MTSFTPPKRLIAQIAADAGISRARALRAIALQQAARAGKTLVEAAASLKIAPGTAQRYARIFTITFPDYSPTAVAAETKTKRGTDRKRLAPPTIALDTGDEE